MTGIRVVAGYGNVTRTTEKISQIPYATTPKAILDDGQLNKRFGAGVEITINKNRNLDYKRDLGFREITMATPGMYDIEFSISGYMSTKNLGWMKNLFLNDSVVLSADTVCYTKDGVEHTGTTYGTAKEVYLIPEADRAYRKICIDKDAFSFYMASILATGDEIAIANTVFPAGAGEGAISYIVKDVVAAASIIKGAKDRTGGNKFIVEICHPERLRNPNDYAFDIGTVKNNKHTQNGGMDEIGILCGCMLTSGSLSYEAGGDNGVKFTLDGFALRDYIQLVDSSYEYFGKIDEVDADILVTGCLSISQKEGDGMTVIAQTDSANFTITNQIEKLPECGEMIYSGGALGTLDVELTVQTYSNEPNRYLPAMYGTGVMAAATTYTVCKLPKPIETFCIRSTDVALQHGLTKFIDIVTKKVYVGAMNHSYATETKILDEPTLKPTTAWVAYGYEGVPVVVPTP